MAARSGRWIGRRSRRQARKGVEYIEASTESGRSLGLRRKRVPSQGASAGWRTRADECRSNLMALTAGFSLSPRACARGQREASARIVGTALAVQEPEAP